MPSPWHDDEVKHFFTYFRSRTSTIERLASEPKTFPDASILLAACLDALANYWAGAFGLSFGRDMRRFGEFLQEFGPTEFERVSGPHLSERARAISPATQFSSAVASIVPEGPSSLVRTWQKDPTLADLAASTLMQVPPPKEGAVEWLKDSRYGERVYKLYRCNWIHEAAESPETGRDVFDRLRDEPGYQNLFDPTCSNSQRRKLILPHAFLARTFAVTLNNFEMECRNQRINPMPP
jgi:hypothetical protein